MKYKILSIFLVLLIIGSVFLIFYLNNVNKRYDKTLSNIDKKIVDIKKDINNDKKKLNRLKENNDKKIKINENTDNYIKEMKEKLNEN